MSEEYKKILSAIDTFQDDWAAQADEHRKDLAIAKSEGLCVYCGDEADNGDCGRYKCWIFWWQAEVE